MLKHGWGALQALKHIRQLRPVEVRNTLLYIFHYNNLFKLNEGFIQQLADLDFKLTWYRTQLAEEKKKKQEEAMNIGTPA